MLPQDLAAYIRHRRQAAGLSRAELAERVRATNTHHITEASIWQYEHGSDLATAAKVLTLLESLGVELRPVKPDS